MTDDDRAKRRITNAATAVTVLCVLAVLVALTARLVSAIWP